MKMTSVIELSSEEVMKAVAGYVSAHTGFDVHTDVMHNIHVKHEPKESKDSLFPSVSFQFIDNDV
jgi:hypothetical protein